MKRNLAGLAYGYICIMGNVNFDSILAYTKFTGNLCIHVSVDAIIILYDIPGCFDYLENHKYVCFCLFHVELLTLLEVGPPIWSNIAIKKTRLVR